MRTWLQRALNGWLMIFVFILPVYTVHQLEVLSTVLHEKQALTVTVHSIHVVACGCGLPFYSPYWVLCIKCIHFCYFWFRKRAPHFVPDKDAAKEGS